MRNMKFAKIKKFETRYYVWLKFEIFDHPGPAKHEIWQNLEIWVALKTFSQI